MKQEDTRQKILDKALELFAAKQRRPTTEGERNGDRSFDPGVSAG